MAGAGLTHVSVGSAAVWSAFNPRLGTFVYVYRYPNTAAAAARAHVLAAEDVGSAGPYVISQSIAPYHDSPVRAVTVCLGGRAPKNPPASTKPGKFTF